MSYLAAWVFLVISAVLSHFLFDAFHGRVLDVCFYQGVALFAHWVLAK
jgi:hypothetical protein